MRHEYADSVILVTMLDKIISERIINEGPITFETFMDMALYYPELGYYTNPATVIGKDGDFYTSSHLHPIFGASICRQLIEMWEIMDRPPVFHAVEMGAGAGYLCRDIMDYLIHDVHKADNSSDAGDFMKCLQYVLVEPYGHFEKMQRDVLQGHILNVKWIKSLDELGPFEGCMLSNELLDAFPVHIIEMDKGPKEIFVNMNDQKLVEDKADINSNEMEKYIDRFDIPISDGYRTELNLRIKSWLEQVSSVLSHGFILTIDYGFTAREFYSEDRSNGTLLCYHQHRVNENPFSNIGSQDITSHVNFSSLKIYGDEAGLKTCGYSSQGIYLTASGLDELIVDLYSDSPDYMREISRIKGLILPQGMGESHRVFIQYKGEGTPELRGFSIRNEAGNL